MRKEEYVIGIDIGTQGTKTAIYSSLGKKEAECFEASRLICPAPGQAYQEPLEIYGSVIRTIRKVMEESGLDGGAVAAIGMDAQMAGIMAIDDQFEAVGVYDSWLDTRCSTYVAKLKNQAEEEIIKKTGGPVTCAHAAKILHRKWEMENEYKKAAKFVLPGVYVAGKLCGLKAEDAYIDFTHLHFSGFGDNQKKKWDQGLLQEFQVEEDKLPRIVSPMQVIGSLTKEAADLCGLTQGTKVAAGCGDSAASALGAGITEKNRIYDVAGTASIFSCSTDIFAPDLEHKTILYARSVIEGLYTPLAYIGGGGLCIKWFIQQHGESYDHFNQAAENIEPGSNGLYFVPHFSGRVCPDDPEIRGAFWGLSFYHQAGHMYRSILESIAYEYAYYFSIIKKQNPQIAPPVVYGAGGGARSGVFNQIKADVLGIAYQPLQEADTAVYASAMLAAAAVGVIPDLKEAIKVKSEGSIYHPRQQEHEAYREYAQNYIELLEKFSGTSLYVRRSAQMGEKNENNTTGNSADD